MPRLWPSAPDLLANSPKQIEADLKCRIQEWCNRFVRGLEKTDPLHKRVHQFYLHQPLFVSVTTEEGVHQAKTSIENLVTTGCLRDTLGLAMTPPYASVLQLLQQKRRISQKHQMKQLLRGASQLQSEQMEEAHGLVTSHDQLLGILRDFHDQGDILWAEDQQKAGPFQDVVVLDPRLVLDLVRELINHNYPLEGKGDAYEALRERGEVSHALLMTFATWKAVSETHEDLVAMFKRLMAFYQLAYPMGTEKMTHNSDLIVPTYWKSSKRQKRATAVVPAPLPLTLAVRSFAGCWQYAVPTQVSEMLFDQFVVQSHSHAFSQSRTVTATCVEAKQVHGAFVVRLVFEDGEHNRDHIRIEVAATSDLICWTTMKFFIQAMEIVLDRYPGLHGVARDLLHHDDDKETQSYAVVFAIKDFGDAQWLGLGVRFARQGKLWLPPHLNWFVNKAWQKPNALAEMEDEEMARQKKMQQIEEVVQQEVESSRPCDLDDPEPPQATRLKYYLRITRAVGIPEREWSKAFCSWELGPAPPHRTLEIGVTRPFTEDAKQGASESGLSWSQDTILLANMAGYSVLRGCQLHVQIKRPRRWLGCLKTICQGTLSLSTILTEEQDEKRTSTPFSITMAGGSGIVVEGILTIEEEQQVTSSHSDQRT